MSDARTETAREIDRFFQDVVLCLGGIFATRELDDDVVWKVTKSLERIYRRHRERVLERDASVAGEPPARRIEPHPAVQDLLARIGR